LEPTGDFERDDDRTLVQVLPRDQDVDLLELARLSKVAHELGHRARRVRRTDDLQRGPAILERRDPQVARHRVHESVEELDGPSLALNQLVDDLDALTDVNELRLDVGTLTQRGLEGVDLLRRAVVLRAEPRLVGDETPPRVPDAQDGDDIKDGEEQAEPDGQRRHREARAAASSCLDGREIDPDHFACSLSPACRRPRPTATARAGAIAVASSA